MNSFEMEQLQYLTTVRERQRISSDLQGFSVKGELYRLEEPSTRWWMVTHYKGETQLRKFKKHEQAVEAWNRFFFELGRDIVFDDHRKRPGKKPQKVKLSSQDIVNLQLSSI